MEFALKVIGYFKEIVFLVFCGLVIYGALFGIEVTLKLGDAKSQIVELWKMITKS